MKKTLLLLFVCLFVGISHAQAQVTVKGTVISSENNEPVIGASVLVKGTTNGTITDINGQFTLTNISPTNKTIIVSFIGMETQEVTIKPEMKIVMTSTTEVMEEVLVVAYGTAKKSAFTGSAYNWCTRFNAQYAYSWYKFNQRRYQSINCIGWYAL